MERSKTVVADNNISNKNWAILKIKLYVLGYIRYSLIFTGKIPSHHIRKFLYKYIYLVDLGKNAVIYGGAEIRDSYKLKIGKGCIIGDNAILDARNVINIGDNVNFSTGVWLWTEQHDYQASDFGYGEKGGSIIIGNRVWIGPRVIVLPKVKIGEGAVVAGGSVVTSDVEPYTLVAGIPARKIGERNRNLTYKFDGSYIPFY